MEVLDEPQWRAREEAHRVRAGDRTRAHLERRRRGERHPGEDFLFEYYGFRPAQLARWHPGPGIGLRNAPDRASWRHYRTDQGVTSLDVDSFRAARGRALDWALRVLEATDAREPSFACFGLHEWAMVYRIDADAVRHTSLPLRLGPDEIADVVDAHEIRCGHYDAFRFFTPAARPRNVLQPAEELQPEFEQPGCLHGGAMDLYRWAFKLDPGVPGELVLDCFDVAREARILDMRSSPYDTDALGYPNIAVETPEGKAEHVRLQRAVAERAAPVRARLIEALRRLAQPTEQALPG